MIFNLVNLRCKKCNHHYMSKAVNRVTLPDDYDEFILRPNLDINSSFCPNCKKKNHFHCNLTITDKKRKFIFFSEDTMNLNLDDLAQMKSNLLETIDFNVIYKDYTIKKFERVSDLIQSFYIQYYNLDIDIINSISRRLVDELNNNLKADIKEMFLIKKENGKLFFKDEESRFYYSINEKDILDVTKLCNNSQLDEFERHSKIEIRS